MPAMPFEEGPCGERHGCREVPPQRILLHAPKEHGADAHAGVVRINKQMIHQCRRTIRDEVPECCDPCRLVGDDV